jgi:hypothetical protein
LVMVSGNLDKGLFCSFMYDTHNLLFSLYGMYPGSLP